MNTTAQQVPPTEVPELPPEPPQWPKVIGIASLAWSVLNLGCIGCGASMPIVTKSLLAGQMKELPPQFTPSVDMWVMYSVSVILTGVLVAAGVMTLMRKPIGKMLHVIWAVCALGVGAWSMYLQLETTRGMQQWAAENPDNPMAKGLTMPGQSLGQLGGLVLGVAVATLYPLFCIVWFGFVKARAKME